MVGQHARLPSQKSRPVTSSGVNEQPHWLILVNEKAREGPFP